MKNKLIELKEKRKNIQKLINDYNQISSDSTYHKVIRENANKSYHDCVNELKGIEKEIDEIEDPCFGCSICLSGGNCPHEKSN